MLKPVFDMTWNKIGDWFASRREHVQKKKLGVIFAPRLSEIGKRSSLTTAKINWNICP